MATLPVHLQSRSDDQNYNYVGAYNGGGAHLYRNMGWPLEWETFILWSPTPPRGGDKVALMVSNGKFVQAWNGGGDTVNGNGPAIGQWETFYIRHSGIAIPHGSTAEILNGHEVSFQTERAVLLSRGDWYLTCPSADAPLRADGASPMSTPRSRFVIWSQGNQARPAYAAWRDVVDSTPV
jgi:hypothetical protein